MNIQSAVENLMEKNRRIMGNHQFTVPSSDIYPFQWLWDSCFHAIILSHYDIGAAKRELQSLLAHPLPSGMLPHMIYWNGEHCENELPNWGREKRGFEINLAWKHKGSSTITQPPVVALATLRVFEVDKDIEFLRSLYETIKRHFEYLAFERTFNGDALLYVINPDESGEDNSPRFDAALGLLPQHSKNESLDKRLRLTNQNAECDFLAKLCMSKHFGIADVSFNVLYATDLKALATIAETLGYSEDATTYATRAAAVEHNILTQLRVNDVFLSFDHINKRHVEVLTWNIFMPLYGGILTQEEATTLVNTYFKDEQYFVTPHGLTTTAKTEPSYDPNDGFWRGPIWFAPHWFIYHGLKRYGFNTEAQSIKDKSLNLLERSGFCEHYHPETGAGLGAQDFTWGALVIDME